MKKLFLLACLSLFRGAMCLAQGDGTQFDVLRAPSSPASNLLGISTTDIDKPTDISSFMVSLQSAGGSFSKFPSNYAIDISPYYVAKKRWGDYTTSGLQAKDFCSIFKQTLVVSIAVTNPDSTHKLLDFKSTYSGLGFKFNILRGDYDSLTQARLSQITALQKQANDLSIKNAMDWLALYDQEYGQLDLRRKEMTRGKDGEDLRKVLESEPYKKITDELSTKLEKFNSGTKKEEIYKSIRSIAAEFQLGRVGLTWDLNGGVGLEFRNRQFNNSKVHNLGIWSTFGYTFKNGVALLGLCRYLYNPNKIFALDNNPNTLGRNISTLDAGLRLVCSRPQSKFSCSIESIYRSVLTSATIQPSWKLVLNADYALFKNQKLTFSFGRDFDGVVSKDGNLIAALTFINGFGNKR